MIETRIPNERMIGKIYKGWKGDRLEVGDLAFCRVIDGNVNLWSFKRDLRRAVISGDIQPDIVAIAKDTPLLVFKRELEFPEHDEENTLDPFNWCYHMMTGRGMFWVSGCFLKRV